MTYPKQRIDKPRGGAGSIARQIFLLSTVLVLSACGGSGGSSGPGTDAPPSAIPGTPPVSPPGTPADSPVPPSTPAALNDPFKTAQSTSRFLTQTSFGPTRSEVNALVGTDVSQWLLAEFAKTPSLHLPALEAYQITAGSDEPFNFVTGNALSFSFWRHAIASDDQLRQRMAFALSQILVVSNFGGELLSDLPEPVTSYQDILSQHAFGNYRDLLEAVTYSPAMGFYLTYMGNQKADPNTGRMPDENYAREILQLFTIGLVELNPDGTPRLDAAGHAIELYTNRDITALARVFTGLDLAGIDRSDPDADEYGEGSSFLRPMELYPQFHSQQEKSFLGTTIPAGTEATQSIALALDHIVAHPNVGPFIGRQLIQRFTTSDPSPAYVQRVAKAFDQGTYELPDGSIAGDGRKGDLAATIAAVLLDPDNAIENALGNPRFGKLREPVLRFTHWARAFEVNAQTPEYVLEIYDTLEPEDLSQHPFRSRSVFNFYRPGYVAPGTQSGALGMTVPELQIVNASSTPGFINFMTTMIFRNAQDIDEEVLEETILEFEEAGFPFDEDAFRTSFMPNYDAYLALARDPAGLIDALSELLTYSMLTSNSQSSIASALETIPLDDEDDSDGLATRVGVAILMILSSPEYTIQR